MNRARRTVAVLLALALAGGSCRRQGPQSPLPAAVPAPAPVPLPDPATLSRWPTTLADALRATEAGRNADADRILTEFGTLPTTTEAELLESVFWRALLRADPTNVLPTTRERISLLDSYLASGPSAPRYAEARVLRRLVEALDSARTVVGALRTAADTRQRAREEEVKRLSEDLDRTMAELERIKRRLAPRPPG